MVGPEIRTIQEPDHSEKMRNSTSIVARASEFQEKEWARHGRDIVCARTAGRTLCSVDRW